MDLIAKLKEVSTAKEFQECKNYYYENHLCSVTDEDVKVRLDYTLSNDIDDNILRFGICPECGKCFYHKDFESKSF